MFFHCSYPAHFHKLHSDGVGIQVKHAEIITPDEEMKLWDSGTMGLDTLLHSKILPSVSFRRCFAYAEGGSIEIIVYSIA